MLILDPLWNTANTLLYSWKYRILYLFHSRYRRNLRGLYVVHGSVWDRIITWFFTLFSAASIKEHIKFLSGVQYLNDYISPDQLEIPPFVLEFDLQVCMSILTCVLSSSHSFFPS